MTEAVLARIENGVRTITLNRPERLNAINDALLAAFEAALAEANADAETRVVVLNGAGRAFCAGDDLKEFQARRWTEDEARGHVEAIQRITREIVLGDKVVVGAIHGWVVGGGLEWAINCDLPIWAENACGFFPEIGIGLFVTGAVTALLPRMVGVHKARELILLGERFDGRQAAEWGLAWRAASEESLLDEARAVAARIAGLPPAQVRDLKRALNRAGGLDIEGAMALETRATIDAFTGPAAAERIAGFGQ